MKKVFIPLLCFLLCNGTVQAQFSIFKKDSDRDGVLDKNDLCPKLFGSKSLQGCPDRDQDGVSDNKDACPDLYAPGNFFGCPDTDGDGLLDHEDRCPQAAGAMMLDGCPDFDGDGIADVDDFCPNVAGIQYFSGCPDSDGDGIVDKEDACPHRRGTSLTNGCPDENAVYADAENFPILRYKPAPKATLASLSAKGIGSNQFYLVKTLKYAPSSTDPMQTSKPVLDEVISILKANPNQKVQLNSFTDSSGNAADNKRLSAKRAKVLLDYLVKKGIDPRRMKAAAFGESTPTTNDTPEAQAMVRRVEMILFTEVKL